MTSPKSYCNPKIQSVWFQKSLLLSSITKKSLRWWWGGHEGEREQKWTEINSEVAAKIQKKNEHLDEGHSGGSEKRSDSGYILKVQHNQLPEEKNKEIIKGNFNILGPNNGSAIY